MTHELAKKLKDAGFPNDWEHWNDDDDERGFIAPTLSELVSACGNRVGVFKISDTESNAWKQMYDRHNLNDEREDIQASGLTPEEAVVNLWLALNKK